MANCEVPDLDLLPARYNISRISFSAGMELPPIHLGIWLLSWVVRAGLPIRLDAMARALLAVSDVFDGFGSADGGMHVLLHGRDHDGRPLSLAWYIVAAQGHGPYIPCVPAVVLAKQLVAETLVLTGAHPCVGLVSLEQYLAELAHLDIRTFEIINGQVASTAAG